MLSLKIIFLWINSLFAPKPVCKHSNINPLSVHDSYCPDCGKRIMFEWYIIKCSDCYTKRSGYHLFEEYTPHYKYCKRCGSNNFEVEVKQELHFFEYSYASFKIKEVDKYTEASYHKKSQTKVWLEPNYTSTYNNKPYSVHNFQLIPAAVSS